MSSELIDSTRTIKAFFCVNHDTKERLEHSWDDDPDLIAKFNDGRAEEGDENGVLWYQFSLAAFSPLFFKLLRILMDDAEKNNEIVPVSMPNNYRHGMLLNTRYSAWMVEIKVSPYPNDYRSRW